MFSVKKYENKKDWDNLILDIEGHPFQLWGWGEVKGGHNWTIDRVEVKKTSKSSEIDDKTIGVAQIFTKKLPWPLKNYSYIPRGTHVKGVKTEELSQFYDQLAQYVKNQYKSVVLSIEPHSFTPLNLTGWGRVGADNSVYVDQTILLHLNESEEVLLANMGRKTRQSINKANRNVDEIKQINTLEDLDECLAIYKLTSERSGFAIHADSYYKKVFKEMGSHSIIYGAYIEGQLVGFLWLALSGKVAYQMYSGINVIGAKNRVNYALRWHAIKKAKEWGLTDYDFGGLMPGGVEQFKKSWDKDITHFAGAYDKPLSMWYPLWKVGRPLAGKVNQKIKALKRRIA